MRRLSLCMGGVCGDGVMSGNPASAQQQLTIYSGGAVKSGLEAAAEAYEKQKGTKIKIEFQPMGPLTKALAEGAKADIAIVTEDVWADTEGKKLVDGATRTEVGRVGIGVAVHESAPSPDISTPEALKAALLKAKSVVYIDPQRGTSGRHFAGVLSSSASPTRSMRRRSSAAAAMWSSRSARARSSSACTRSPRSCR